MQPSGTVAALCALLVAAAAAHSLRGHPQQGASNATAANVTAMLKAANVNANVTASVTAMLKAPNATAAKVAADVTAMLKAPNATAAKVAEDVAAMLKAPNATAAAPAPHRARLDVGFATFEKDAEDIVARAVNSALNGSAWNDALRAKVAANVTAMLKASLDTTLKPVKQNIGKTWMVLPEQDQKDKYVEQLRESFADTLSTAVQNIGKHANMTLGRLAVRLAEAEGKPASNLAEQASAGIRMSIVEDHCYEDETKPKKASGKANATAPLGHFCVPSIVQRLGGRLKDSENLVGMSMKFEAKALAMVQSRKANVR